jgi:inner membrane protein
MKGSFKPVSFDQLKINPANIGWNNVKLLFKVQDPLKGINEDLSIDWQGQKLPLNGQFTDPGTLSNAFEAPLVMSATDSDTSKTYSMSFTLNGSTQLLFSPLARDNSIEVKSAWADPAFTGIRLPDNRVVDDKGFTAQWKFMNRTLPQTTDRPVFDVAAAGFGVDLLIRVDNYDKTERSIKYALLCIILTFAALFLI